MRYSKKRKEQVLKKMMPPRNKTIRDIAKEEGITEATLYRWRKEARRRGKFLPSESSTPEGWTSEDKFSAVLETASMNQQQIAEYCRKRGIYPEQIVEWREACKNANDWEEEQQKKIRKSLTSKNKKIRALEKELNRKEKALAEAAAMVWLKKKAIELWGEDEEG